MIRMFIKIIKGHCVTVCMALVAYWPWSRQGCGFLLWSWPCALCYSPSVCLSLALSLFVPSFTKGSTLWRMTTCTRCRTSSTSPPGASAARSQRSTPRLPSTSNWTAKWVWHWRHLRLLHTNARMAVMTPARYCCCFLPYTIGLQILTAVKNLHWPLGLPIKLVSLWSLTTVTLHYI